MTPALSIRFAMLLGVLMFGGVVWFSRQQADAATLSMEQARAFVTIGRVLWALAVGGAIFAFTRREQGGTRGGIRLWSIVGWALGEMVALFGAVVWFLGGPPSWYIAGLLFFLSALVAFPSRQS